jgi:hypothetical protein
VIIDSPAIEHGIIRLIGFGQTVVKVTMDALPSIKDLEFKDFIRLKQSKGPEYALLGTQKRDLYLLTSPIEGDP